MKPIFTIHAGEYLVGEFLEKKFTDCEVWLPARDSGIDLLLTNKFDKSRNTGIQVKFSKDFLPTMEAAFHRDLFACGWWTLNAKKLKNSKADFWVLAPYSFFQKKIGFVILKPQELYKRLVKIHGNKKLINVYLWITNNKFCFETRGLKKEDQLNILKNKTKLIDKNRDFTKYLNNFSLIKEKVSL